MGLTPQWGVWGFGGAGESVLEIRDEVWDLPYHILYFFSKKGYVLTPQTPRNK